MNLVSLLTLSGSMAIPIMISSAPARCPAQVRGPQLLMQFTGVSGPASFLSSLTPAMDVWVLWKLRYLSMSGISNSSLRL